MEQRAAPPNHHASYPAFAGASGLVAALSMVFGRKNEARLAAEMSGLGPGDTIVDLGCGPGVAVRYAARMKATPIGVDPAPVMLRVARLLTRHSADVEYIEGAAEAIPLKDESATVIWSIATVHHWRDLDAGLAEVRRVLLPRGRFVAMERRARPDARGHESHGWTDDQATTFADRCREAGFLDARLDRSNGGRRPMVSVIAGAP